MEEAPAGHDAQRSNLREHNFPRRTSGMYALSHHRCNLGDQCVRKIGITLFAIEVVAERKFNTKSASERFCAEATSNDGRPEHVSVR